jgi:release factor glutamine methyltransferase
MNINEAIKRGKFILEKNLIKNSQLDSEILMSKVINKDRKFVILNSKNELEENQ